LFLEHPVKEIRQEALRLYLDMRSKEKKKKVKKTLDNPEYVRLIKEKLRQEWERPETEIERLIREQQAKLEELKIEMRRVELSAEEKEKLREEIKEELGIYTAMVGNIEEMGSTLEIVVQDIEEIKKNLEEQKREIESLRIEVVEIKTRVIEIEESLKEVPIEERIREVREQVLGENEFEILKRQYIPLGAKVSIMSENVVDLNTEIEKFMRGEGGVFLLTGEAGGGKTTYTEMLNHRLWEEYREGGVIPVYVELPQLRDPIRGIIKETLIDKWRLSEEQVIELGRTRRLMFILDGYDEINTNNNLIVTNGLLEKFNGNVLITCRSQGLPDKYRDSFAPLSGTGFNYRALREWMVAPFNEGQIEDYIRRFLAMPEREIETDWDVERYKKNINEIRGLRGLIENPYTLKIMTNVLPEIVEKHEGIETEERLELTRYDLYKEYVESLFNRQKIKLIRQGRMPKGDVIKYFWGYFIELAKAMYGSKLTRVLYESEREDLFGEGEDEERKKWSKFF